MRPIAHLVATAALALLGADALAASVTCQSRNNQPEECRLPGRGEVVLSRQISKTPCVKGRNWEETRHGVAVTDGCGGVFETRSGWDNLPRPGAKDKYDDLLGTRASDSEPELRRRGYRDVRSDAAPGGRFVFWRTPQRGCIEVRVADGRFLTMRPVANSICDDKRPGAIAPPLSDIDGTPPVKALFACNQRIANSGLSNDPQDAVVQRQTRIRPDVWELVLGTPQGLFDCTVTEEGVVQVFNPVR